jgi:hypothetical protein
MRKAEEYWNKVSLPFHVLDIVKSKILEAIRAAQIDAIEETCKRCAEESIVEIVDHEELSIETLPANDGKTVILPIYGVDEDSILKIADKMKEELE